MRRMLAGLALLGTTLLTLSGCAGAVLTERASATTPRIQIGPPGQGTAAANHAAARRDALALLKRLTLPASAAPAVSEPHGDHGYLKATGALEGDSANALSNAWWTIAEPVGTVVAYLKTHAPAGSSQPGDGSEGDTRTGTSAKIVNFEWPSVGHVLGYRGLQVTVTALPGGRSGILAEAQSDWVVPRSAAERVPTGANTVRVTLQRRSVPVAGGHASTVSQVLITAPRTVAHAVRLVDALAVVQPIEIMCPLELLTGESLTVTYSAGPRGPALAQARVSLLDLSSGGASICNPIEFSIRGREQTGLIGASFVQQIEKLAGLSSR